MSSQFSLRPKPAPLFQSGIVYEFHCNKDSCQATYVGYSQNRLITRAKQHKYSQSKISQHYVNEHKTKPDQSIIDCFSILYKSNRKRNLLIAEALIIKREKPYINVKYNEMSSGLNIY